MADTTQNSSEGDPLAQGEAPETSQRGSFAPAVLTFLIADVRGYTRFTQEHGDEDAGRLAGLFAELARETVLSCGGELIELRGDEALCVFGSARQALRAAVELQMRFRRGTDDGPAFPLPIGIGLDAGEAVPIEGGYRGAALNTAARLCSMARPGEILATDTVVSLAQRLEGIRFVARRPMRLKGLEKPVRVFEVTPEAGLPPLPVIVVRKRPWATRRRLAVAAIVSLAALGAILFAVIRHTGESIVPGNSVAVIDPESNEVIDAIAVGEGPGPIAAAGNALWVTNLGDRTLARIDPATRTRTMTVGLPGANPNSALTRLAGDPGDLWVAVDCFVTLYRMDPGQGQIIETLPLSGSSGPPPGQLLLNSCAITADSESVWIVVHFPPQLVRVDAPADRLASVAQRIPLPPGVRTSIALGAGSVWLLDRIGVEGTAIRRINPATGDLVKRISVDEAPEAMVFGHRAVWVVNQTQSSVLRIRPRTNSVVRQISVGRAPSAIAVGGGAVWVANTVSGTVSRIDPETTTVTKTIELGHRPSEIVFHDGLVWVTVRE
jgi:YVTN family beta-propeller protein